MFFKQTNIGPNAANNPLTQLGNLDPWQTQIKAKTQTESLHKLTPEKPSKASGTNYDKSKRNLKLELKTKIFQSGQDIKVPSFGMVFNPRRPSGFVCFFISYIINFLNIRVQGKYARSVYWVSSRALGKLEQVSCLSFSKGILT